MFDCSQFSPSYIYISCKPHGKSWTTHCIPCVVTLFIIIVKIFFFSRTRRRTTHQYIKKKKGGVETPGDIVMGLYRALTTDAYRLLQTDIGVGPYQKEHLDRMKVLGEEVWHSSSPGKGPLVQLLYNGQTHTRNIGCNTRRWHPFWMHYSFLSIHKSLELLICCWNLIICFIHFFWMVLWSIFYVSGTGI